jgi:hypothetical protein
MRYYVQHRYTTGSFHSYSEKGRNRGVWYLFEMLDQPHRNYNAAACE